jgi:hypothetical protein
MNNADRKLEETLADLGVPGPRVTLAMVEEILATVTYSTRVVEGTTSTVAVAILPSGFVLATGLAACVARENFNPALGIEMAISKARDLAREAIWQHEGYRLSQAIHEARQGNASAALKQIRTVLGSQAEPNELHKHSVDCPSQARQDCASRQHSHGAGRFGGHEHCFLVVDRPESVMVLGATEGEAIPACSRQPSLCQAGSHTHLFSIPPMDRPKPHPGLVDTEWLAYLGALHKEQGGIGDRLLSGSRATIRVDSQDAGASE